MDLLPFFEWCEATWIGHTIRDSLWLFPVIESFHLLGLAMIGGLVLLVDLRLLGVGLRQRPVAELARDTHRWLIGSLIVMAVTGVLLFLSEAVKCYYSDPFWIKMEALALGVIFTMTVRRRVTSADPMRIGPVKGRLVAVVSLVLWSTVAWGGRWIGFAS